MPGYSAGGLPHMIYVMGNLINNINKNAAMQTYFYFHEKDESKLHYWLISGLD